MHPHRFGKKSLVFKAIEQLEKQGFTCIYFYFMPVFSPESLADFRYLATRGKRINKRRDNRQKRKPHYRLLRIADKQIYICYA